MSKEHFTIKNTQNISKIIDSPIKNILLINGPDYNKLTVFKKQGFTITIKPGVAYYTPTTHGEFISKIFKHKSGINFTVLGNSEEEITLAEIKCFFQEALKLASNNILLVIFNLHGAIIDGIHQQLLQTDYKKTLISCATADLLKLFTEKNPHQNIILLKYACQAYKARDEFMKLPSNFLTISLDRNEETTISAQSQVVWEMFEALNEELTLRKFLNYAKSHNSYKDAVLFNNGCQFEIENIDKIPHIITYYIKKSTITIEEITTINTIVTFEDVKTTGDSDAEGIL